MLLYSVYLKTNFLWQKGVFHRSFDGIFSSKKIPSFRLEVFFMRITLNEEFIIEEAKRGAELHWIKEEKHPNFFVLFLDELLF